MDRINGVVTQITQLTDRISSFEVAQASGAPLPAYTAGAHVLFDLPDGDTRAYSLISFDPIPKTPSSYRVAVQLEPEGKGGSKHMHGLAKGAQISFVAPKNDFPLDISAPAVLLAGGIGVTPMISMASALRAANQQFAFHYAGRTRAMMGFADALETSFGDALHLHADDDPATALDLGGLIAGLGQAHLYVCGPRGMIDAARSRAEAAGIPPERIHFELFEAAAPAAGDTAFEVEISSTGAVFTIPPGKTIIDVLEEGGVDVIYDCQRGDCGICQCDVLDGTPDHRDVVLSDAERASGKIMQICVSRAKSPRLVLDI
ncbi:MAG: PDR/VanB family oxidoreductase [Sulfitobacter sp.]